MVARRRNGKYTPAASGGKWIRKVKRQAIYMRDGHCCVYCGSSVNMQFDHYVRVQDGGSNMANNLVTCCAFCNNSKSNLTIRRWGRRLAARGIDTRKAFRRARRCMARDLAPFLVSSRLLLRPDEGGTT